MSRRALPCDDGDACVKKKQKSVFASLPSPSPPPYGSRVVFYDVDAACFVELRTRFVNCSDRRITRMIDLVRYHLCAPAELRKNYTLQQCEHNVRNSNSPVLLKHTIFFFLISLSLNLQISQLSARRYCLFFDCIINIG